jgi:hypothetical protein
MCQSATGRVALLAPVEKQAGCRDVGRHASVVPGAGTPSALSGKASPDETERVGHGHSIDLHGFTVGGHCCARTASFVQRRSDGHAARVSVMRACIART